MNERDDARNQRAGELLTQHLAPVLGRLDELKTRLDLIGAVAAGPADFEKAINVHANVTAMVAHLREEMKAALVALHAKILDDWRRESFEANANYAHSAEVYPLKGRIARLETMLVARWISPELEARVRAENPTIEWEDAMRVFQRWLVYEPALHDTGSGAASRLLRKFVKLWQQGFFKEGFRPGKMRRGDGEDDSAAIDDGDVTLPTE